MTVEEACKKLLEEITPIDEKETLAISSCNGRVLAEDVFANLDVPSFPRSAMDGYAVKSCEVQGAAPESPVSLRVVDSLMAGDYKEIAYCKNSAVRVMTGAFIPPEYDCVVKQEDSDYGEKSVKIYAPQAAYTNYCKRGEDIQSGQKLLCAGKVLKPLHAGLLASLGINKVSVYRKLKVSIISTGSELCLPGNPLSPGKIYESISPMLRAQLFAQGIELVSACICPDREEQIADAVLMELKRSDVIITVGGVSVGKKDLVPSVLLNRLGAKKVFQGVDIQPGTPTMACFLENKAILSLSGNPYAALANFELYFWNMAAAYTKNSEYLPVLADAVLKSPYNKINKHRRLLRARYSKGDVYLPSKVHSSSVISNLEDCNCYIDLEALRSVSPGDTVRIRMMKGFTL